MRIGVSNLLWTPDLDEAVAGLLNRRGIDAIDIAPTRYFADVATASPAAWGAVRGFWKERGIAITGMQSLLYGTRGLNIFGGKAVCRRTRAHLRTVMAIGAELGAQQLVFGSWRNRDPGSLADGEALERATDFFIDLASDAQRLGVCLTIEPISERYGNHFLVDHDQAAALVQRVDSEGFRLTLDIGCAGLAGEDIAGIVGRHERLISHVQLAEYGLSPLCAANPLHAVAGPVATRALPGRVACIEALKPPDISSLDAIAQSLDVAQRHYR
jgi:sugar phosphate isomerase/epimerase